MGTNDPICFHDRKNWRKLDTEMAGSRVLLALNSLSDDGMVRLNAEERAQFSALVDDYFNTSDGSDDGSSGSDDEMECGK